MISYLLPIARKPFEKGSTFKGKNLLQKGQILFLKGSRLLKSESKIKTEDLLLMKEYPFNLIPASRLERIYNFADV